MTCGFAIGWHSAGIDPNASVSTIVVPPPQMVANMKVGSMDAFCVGEPWNLQLIHQKIGYTAVTTGELWNNHPEKALSLRADYVQANPNATKAILKAVMEAQMFCDDPRQQRRSCKNLLTAQVDQRTGWRHHRAHERRIRLWHWPP